MAKKATEYLEVEVWVLVNEDGEYEVACDQDTLAERWAEGDYQQGTGQRVAQIKLRVPKPSPIVINGVLPEELVPEAELIVS